MKSPQGLLPIAVSCPDPHGLVDVGSHDAKLLVTDTSAEHAEFVKVACNSHETLVKALVDAREHLSFDIGGDEVASAENIIAVALTKAGVE